MKPRLSFAITIVELQVCILMIIKNNKKWSKKFDTRSHRFQPGRDCSVLFAKCTPMYNKGHDMLSRVFCAIYVVSPTRTHTEKPCYSRHRYQ